MGANASLEVSMNAPTSHDAAPTLTLTIARRALPYSPPARGSCCPLTPAGLHEYFSAPVATEAKHIKSPFLTTLMASAAFRDVMHAAPRGNEPSEGQHADVVVVCDRSIALATFFHAPCGAGDADSEWAFPTMGVVSTGLSAPLPTPGSRRSSASSLLTTITAALVLNGQVYAPLTGTPPIIFAVTTLDASFNDVGDSEGLWVAQELVDRCERSFDACPNALRYAERLRQQITSTLNLSSSSTPSPPLPVLTNIGERVVHAFANTACGPRVRLLMLRGAKLTTLGMSRMLRTLFQRHEVVLRGEHPQADYGLVCGSLEVVDLRGPWTDSGGTAVRVVEELYRRLDQDGLERPEVLLQGDAACQDMRPASSTASDLCAPQVVVPPVVVTRKSTENIATVTPHELTAADTPCSVVKVPHHQVAKQRATDAMTQDEEACTRIQPHVETSHSSAQSTPAAATPPTRFTAPPVLSLQSNPIASTRRAPPTSTSVPPLPVTVSITSLPQIAVSQREVEVDDSSDASTCDVLDEADVASISPEPPLLPPLLRPVDVRASLDAGGIAMLELQEVALRCKIATDSWQSKFLCGVDRLTKLVAQSTNAVAMKSDGLVAELRVSTASSVAFVHHATVCLQQSLAGVIRVLADIAEGDGDDERAGADPGAAAQRIGLGIVECFGTDVSMMHAETYLCDLDGGTPHASSSNASHQKAAAAEVVAVFASIMKAHRFLVTKPPSSLLHHQWGTFWRSLSDCWLSADEESLLSSNTTVAEFQSKLRKTIALLRDVAAKVEAELVRWTLTLMERWTALLRRWLVEGEIARRQAVRALNRRRQDVVPGPQKAAPSALSAAATPRTKVDTFEDPASDLAPTTPRGSQRHRTTPTKTRTTSPTGVVSPSYTHVKAKVSTRRPYEPPRTQTHADEHHQERSGTLPHEEQGGTPDVTERPALSSPPQHHAAPHHADVLLSPPRTCAALLPRGTNTTALRRIVTLETKIAELELQKGQIPPQRRRRPSEAALVGATEPLPREGAAPMPSTMSWCLPQQHVAAPQHPAPGSAQEMHAPAPTVLPVAQPLPTNAARATITFAPAPAPKENRSTSTHSASELDAHPPSTNMCTSTAFLSYVTPLSTRPLPQQQGASMERSASTNASVETAHAILFHPAPSSSSSTTKANLHVTPTQWSLPSKALPSGGHHTDAHHSAYVSSNVLSYILSSGTQRTTAGTRPCSAAAVLDAAPASSLRSSSMQYFARSSSRSTDEEQYSV